MNPTPNQPLISEEHRHILRHALGLERTTVSYRNHFNTGPGSTDFPLCEELVELGLMTRHTNSFVPDTIYMVTGAGKEVAKL